MTMLPCLFGSCSLRPGTSAVQSSSDVAATDSASPLHVDIYIERSGSMSGYDAAGSDGRFKAAVMALLNAIPAESGEPSVHVVNDSIYEYPDGASRFLSDGDIFGATRGIGDASHTDFAAIFAALLGATKENDLCIFVSDLIYSTETMEGVSAQKVFAEIRGMTQSVFRSPGDRMLLVARMTGGFDGRYYPYDGATGEQYSGDRPYYIIVSGSGRAMACLAGDVRYATLRNIAGISGYEWQHLFAPSGTYSPRVTLLLSHPSIRGRFHAEHGSDDAVLAVEDVKAERGDSCVVLALAVDCREMLVDDRYLADVGNYEVESGSDVSVIGVERYDGKALSTSDARRAEGCTHVVLLAVNGPVKGREVRVRLVNRFPQWIEEGSTDDDRDVHAATFAVTTFGLRYLLGGIYDAYANASGGQPYYYDVMIRIK